MGLPKWVQELKEPRAEIEKGGRHFCKYKAECHCNKDMKQTDKILIGLLGEITESEGYSTPSDKQIISEWIKIRISDKNTESTSRICVDQLHTNTHIHIYIRGRHRHCSDEHLQGYLDEYHSS